MRAAQQYDQAEDLYTQALQCAENVYPPKDRHIAALHNNLSMLYQETGRPEAAERELRETMRVLREASDDPSTDIDLAKAAMKAEQTFIGVPVGIMDPFTSAMGRKGNAIYLSTTMLKYNYVPLKFEGRRIIITDSRIKHADSISAFLERKKECEKALRKFRSIVNIRALCDLSVERFETCKDVLMEPVLVKRARHVVCENFRTIRALSVFRVNKPQIFGKLMKESHISLRDDYEVTCPELDFLAEEAWKFPGVLGSRMTGRGFGGCTVSIVDTDRVDEFCSTLEAAYLERFQRKPNFYIADAGDGAREI